MLQRLLFSFKIIDKTEQAISIKYIRIAEFPVPKAEQPISAVFFQDAETDENVILGYVPINFNGIFPVFVKIEIVTNDDKINTVYDEIFNDSNMVSIEINNGIKTFTRKSIIVLSKYKNEALATIKMVNPSAF